MSDMGDLLNAREKTHGEYGEQSATAQRIKHVMRNTPNWCKMPDYMREAIEMIATKLARIGHGDYMHLDSHEDIAGYATLSAREIKDEKDA